jgi:hypothetical protein
MLFVTESFGQNYPEEFGGSSDSISLVVTCAFNKYGTLLSVGCNDVRIIILDFLTRGIAKIISAHGKYNYKYIDYIICNSFISLLLVHSVTRFAVWDGRETVTNFFRPVLTIVCAFGMCCRETVNKKIDFHRQY